MRDAFGSAPRTAELAALRSRTDRILLVALGAYGLALVALAALDGVAVSPDIVAMAGLLVALVVFRRRLPMRDWLAFVALALAYELIRGFESGLLGRLHTLDVIAAERELFGGRLATQILQVWLHPARGIDPIATAATALYMLQPVLPLVVGAWLWVRRRSAFYEWVGALVILSISAFLTYLLFPVAPPWWSAAAGYLAGPHGTPLISYLQPAAFEALAGSAGFDGRLLLSLVFGGLSPDPVASFPSLHAGYPFLALLIARRVPGRGWWLFLAYTLAVWFSVVYLGDHFVVDILGGVAYATAAYLLVVHAPGWLARRGARPPHVAAGAPGPTGARGGRHA